MPSAPTKSFRYRPVCALAAAIALLVILDDPAHPEPDRLTTSQTSSACPGDYAGLANTPAEVAGLLDAFSLRQHSPKFLPKIEMLVRNTIKAYACRYLVNYYAALDGKIASQVFISTGEVVDNHLTYTFGTKGIPRLCGAIDYEHATTTNLPEDTTGRYITLNEQLLDAFRALFEASLKRHGEKTASAFVPINRTNWIAPSKEPIITELLLLQATVFRYHLMAVIPSVAKPHSPPAVADLEFLKNTSCTIPLPTASAPDIMSLRSEPDALRDYTDFAEWLDSISPLSAPAE